MICLQTFGIDISSYSGDPDWNKVVATLNPRFVFARAYHLDENSAKDRADPKFAAYWTKLAELRLPRGAYLFCHPKIDASISIQKFFSVYKPQAGDLLPTLDIEDIYDNSSAVPLQKRIQQVEKMIQLVAARIGGQKPMIYTKTRVWNDLGNPPQFADCPLWVLNYNTLPTPQNQPATWPTFAFWQYGENLKVKHVIDDYDPNLFNGSEAELSNYLIRNVTP
jgi:GH25 family lysozyme M1 (1,4-beta-N-acetylmuramidase)